MDEQKGAMESLVTDASRPNDWFWQGRRVLLTGHTGFKGAWLAILLRRLGANVTGIGLQPESEPNLFELAGIKEITDSHICDIRDAASVRAIATRAEPEVVFHLAAQSLVRAGYRDPLDTFSTNIQGTANVLNAMRGMGSVRCIVVVTTDKVYENLEQPYPYRETDPLGGHDPYSASKAAAEIIVHSYREAYLSDQGVAVASARAGNVIGGGDWSEDRLIPDAIRAWNAKEPLEVRRPQAVRPWQHVLEPLSGYVNLAAKLVDEPELAGPYNFGPATDEAASVREVIELARGSYRDANILWGDGQDGPHEAGWLALEIAKARDALGIRPVWGLAESVRLTMAWYQRQREGVGARNACEQDIDAFENAVVSREHS